MGSPVVHFEIMGKDAAKTQAFYSSLFGWKVDANNEWNYGMVEKDEGGIAGGVGANPMNTTYVTVYVQVADPQATLDKAVEMGSTVVMPVTEMSMVTMALFNDPDGNLVGIVKE